MMVNFCPAAHEWAKKPCTDEEALERIRPVTVGYECLMYVKISVIRTRSACRYGSEEGLLNNARSTPSRDEIDRLGEQSRSG